MKTCELPPNMKWIDVDYWAVFDYEKDPDEVLFQGSKTACKQFARKHKLTISHVIMEAVPC